MMVTLGRAERPTLGIGGSEVVERRDSIDALTDDLLAHAELFHVSPTQAVSRVRFWDTRERATELRIISLSMSREIPWSEQEVDGATVHFVWLRDGKVEWARALPALPKLHPSGDQPAAVLLVQDGQVQLEGSPALLLSKNGRFLPPRRWFGDPTANRVAFKIVAGIGTGLADDIAALEKPNIRSSLHAGVSLAHLAAESGHVEALKALKRAGADVDAEGSRHETPLDWAAAHGRLEVVEWLLESGARPRAKRGGAHPIETALRSGHGEVVAALYKRAKTKKLRDEMLAGAARMGDRELSRRLLAELSDFQLRWLDREPLWWIAQSNDVDLMAEMLDRGVEATRRPFDEPLLNLAARAGDVAMMRLLLDRGAKIEAQTPTGRTALIEATLGGFPEAAALLLERGAKVERKDHEGRTALDYATQRNNSRLAALLMGTPTDSESSAAPAPVWAPWQVEQEPSLLRRPDFLLVRDGMVEVDRHYQGRVMISELLTRGGGEVVGEVPGQVSSYAIASTESTAHLAIWSGVVEVDGTVSAARMLSARPREFRPIMEGAMGGYRFKPGHKDGRDVRTRIVWLEDLR